MRPAELERRLEENPLLVLPFGTMEWHSYHLPIGLDSLKAAALCERLAARTGATLGPITHWAVGGVSFPLTLQFELGLIETLAQDIFRQMAALGFRVIVALTGHFSLNQLIALKRAALDTMRASPATVFAGAEYEVVTDAGYHGDHAAKWETSLLWAVRPDLVYLTEVHPAQPLDGIIGEDPRTGASPALGEELVERILQRLADLSQRLLGQTPPAERARHIEALAAGVRVLERLAAERAVRPKSEVPPVVTPAYVQYLEALYHGNYLDAQRHAEAKLDNLSA